jgi:hypothetical protein
MGPTDEISLLEDPLWTERYTREEERLQAAAS